MAESVGVLWLVVALQVKHFLADYLGQPGWMVMGKASFRQAGGYAHVGVHVVGTAFVLLLFQVPVGLSVAILAAEAVAHYLIDMGKANWSRIRPASPSARAYWAAHGADQLAHQLTYAIIVYVIIRTW